MSSRRGTCPFGAQSSNGGVCPAGHSSGQQRMGPRGCAFSGFSMEPQGVLYGAPQGPHTVQILREREEKTMVDLLLPEAPPKSATKGLKNADGLNPAPLDVLAMALGAPARRVLSRAEELGPLTGWRDGYLTTNFGFCPPEPSASPMALAMSPGRVWSDLCNRMPGIVARGKIREAILQMPLVSGDQSTIPDDALWAATVCLGILASVYRYEERNDGHEGIVAGAHPSAFLNATGDAEDEEEETRGVPRNVAIPLRTICTRMGRALPHLTQFDVSIFNYKIRDPTSIDPYVARRENMDLRWPVFDDYAEANFLLCMAEVHGAFVHGPELIARCQERVMERDNQGLVAELVRLKEVIDQLGYVFHKISVNPGSGENFANPVFWGQRYAKFSAPLSSRVPALSGLALPLFQLMDAFLGRTAYDTFLGIEALHLRAWMPLNWRAFIAAVETHYKVPEYILSTGDPTLMGLLDGLVEAYAGERGFMGTHRYKVYGFLEVVAKTGRVETNGNAGGGDNAGRPWEAVHQTLSDSMIERLQPFRKSITHKPNEMRGCYEECRTVARIIRRERVDNDPERTTAKVTIDLEDTGITFAPGDRLAIMPKNSTKDIIKMLETLGLEKRLDEEVPLDKSADWAGFAKHQTSLGLRGSGSAAPLSVRDILVNGHLAPLTRDIVHAIHILLRASSSTVLKVLASDTWPVNGSMGDLLRLAVHEVSRDTWDKAFDLDDLSWLPKLVPLEVPRTYSISSYSLGPLPSRVDLTVTRSEHEISPLLRGENEAEVMRPGVSSGFLNPFLSSIEERDGYGVDEVLIGISRPINFQLPSKPMAPIGMFCGGSGIAPFRGFWNSRILNGRGGRNLLFLGVQSREKFLYEDELRSHVRNGDLEVHTAFSRDTAGLVFDPQTLELREKTMEPRYLDVTIVENARTVCDLIMSTKQGGCGGYIYICGSVPLYETVMAGIRRAIYVSRTSSEKAAEALLAVAFAERRIMLDIFMTPRSLSYNEPILSLAELAQHTGHREGSRMWIGVHGAVYDITDFLPAHPGGTLIVAASAGLDASKTFDDLAHTNNPEVASLLSKYFIGYLAPKPKFYSNQLDSFYEDWLVYMRTCVETLTTLSFEVQSILSDSKVWFQGDMLNMGGVRKFYQFQSRFMQNGFLGLFGPKLQELYLKLTFAVSNSEDLDDRLPDVMGMINKAQMSKASISAQKEIAAIGDFVCDGAGAQSFENGILQYAKDVTEQDVRFLELVLKDICAGLDAFDILQASSSRGEKVIMYKISRFLLSVLERVAQRLQDFYGGLAQHSIYNPNLEKNPARARWQLVQRYIRDGSFFIYASSPRFDPTASSENDYLAQEPQRGRRQYRESVNFSAVMSSVNDMIRRQQDTRDSKPRAVAKRPPTAGPRRLADQHMERADANNLDSSFGQGLDENALNQISSFINGNLKSIRRLSRIPPSLDELSTLARQINRKTAEDMPAPLAAPSRSHTYAPAHSEQREPSYRRPPIPSIPAQSRSNSSIRSAARVDSMDLRGRRIQPSSRVSSRGSSPREYNHSPHRSPSRSSTVNRIRSSSRSGSVSSGSGAGPIERDIRSNFPVTGSYTPGTRRHLTSQSLSSTAEQRAHERQPRREHARGRSTSGHSASGGYGHGNRGDEDNSVEERLERLKLSLLGDARGIGGVGRHGHRQGELLRSVGVEG